MQAGNVLLHFIFLERQVMQDRRAVVGVVDVEACEVGTEAGLGLGLGAGKDMLNQVAYYQVVLMPPQPTGGQEIHVADINQVRILTTL